MAYHSRQHPREVRRLSGLVSSTEPVRARSCPTKPTSTRRSTSSRSRRGGATAGPRPSAFLLLVAKLRYVFRFGNAAVRLFLCSARGPFPRLEGNHTLEGAEQTDSSPDSSLDSRTANSPWPLSPIMLPVGAEGGVRDFPCGAGRGMAGALEGTLRRFAPSHAALAPRARGVSARRPAWPLHSTHITAIILIAAAGQATGRPV